MLPDEKVAPPYAPFLQEQWIEIISLSIDMRKKLLMDEIDLPTIADFGSRVSRLWVEIEPKVRGRDDFKFSTEFYSFQKFCKDPKASFEGKKEMSIPTDTIVKLFDIELILREALEFSKVTTW